MWITGSNGLLDPCERDQIDSIAYLTAEDRELVTYTAQVIHCCDICIHVITLVTVHATTNCIWETA